jgi:hypothetical protein
LKIFGLRKEKILPISAFELAASCNLSPFSRLGFSAAPNSQFIQLNYLVEPLASLDHHTQLNACQRASPSRFPSLSTLILLALHQQLPKLKKCTNKSALLKSPCSPHINGCPVEGGACTLKAYFSNIASGCAFHFIWFQLVASLQILTAWTLFDDSL